LAYAIKSGILRGIAGRASKNCPRPSLPDCTDKEDEMEHYKLTKHAERRANQRGIKHTTIETMLDFGASKISHGCEVIYMDQAARANLRNRIGITEYAKIERRLDKILVLSDDGVVVTCCQRTRSVRTRKN
jgi:hypothetical protein